MKTATRPKFNLERSISQEELTGSKTRECELAVGDKVILEFI